MSPVLLRLSSGVGKVGAGRVAVTYASLVSTCPRTCPHFGKGEGCYARLGRLAPITARLNAARATAHQAARAEARAIRYWAKHAPAGRPLRLHVAGDSATDGTARIVSGAARAWPGPVWTYTHAWREVARVSWGAVSVFGSIENMRHGRAVLRKGYAPAAIVASHPEDGRAFHAHGVKWIPCPEQTRGVACADCRLCFDAEGLRARKSGVTFAAHGIARARVLRHLPIPSHGGVMRRGQPVQVRTPWAQTPTGPLYAWFDGFVYVRTEPNPVTKEPNIIVRAVGGIFGGIFDGAEIRYNPRDVREVNHG